MSTAGRRPDLSVVVPSQARRVGLLWLLDALAAQEPRDGSAGGHGWFEVLVVHDGLPSPLLEAAAEHPLVRAGVARLLAVDGPASAARKRNVGWRRARAPLVAFTDDDCRPRPGWGAAFLRGAERRPGALLQGGAAIDPDAHEVALRAPRPRLQRFAPPTPWAESCSLALPRALLQRLDGFDESYARVGEDTDLAWRAREAGARWLAVPDAVVDHAVETPGLRGALRAAGRFGETARLVRRHPGLRAHLPGRVFWSPAHAWVLPAAVGTALALLRRRPSAVLLAAPWVAGHVTRYGHGPRGLARGATELPGDLLVDALGVAAFARASLRERSLLL